MDFTGMMMAASRLMQAGVVAQGAKPPEPVRNVVLLQGPDKGFRAITRSVVAPELERAGAKVTVIGDGDNPVTEKQIKDGMAALEGPTTLLVMAHGVDEKGRYKIDLGRQEATYVEDAIFAHVNDKVKGVCLMGCNAETALGKGVDGKRYIDKLPMGTDVRAFSAANDVSTTFDYLAFGATLKHSGTLDNGDFAVDNLWRDFVSTDIDHLGLKFADKVDRDEVPSKVGIAGVGVRDLKEEMAALKGTKFSEGRIKALYEMMDNKEANVTQERVAKVAGDISKGEVKKDDVRLALVMTDAQHELTVREKAPPMKAPQPPAPPMPPQKGNGYER